MNQNNRAFLDANRWAQESYNQDMPPRKLGFKDREQLARIYKEAFDPGYSPDLWCSDCVKAMVINVYALYDQYLKNESSKLRVP